MSLSSMSPASKEDSLGFMYNLLNKDYGSLVSKIILSNHMYCGLMRQSHNFYYFII